VQILAQIPNVYSNFELLFGILRALAHPLRELGPVLIANRGEIAVRVARSVHAAGLRSVSVYCEPDAGALHAARADAAVLVGSYLDADELVAAARRSGAHSVHPGYGFLSENAGFARAVIEAGLTWIGPPPAAIELLGDKGRSKQLARETGVPVVPGTEGADADAATVAAFVAEHGFPVMVKALAGGGGKGMRVVATADRLEDALAGARREAKAAFGDGRVLVERLIERPRHIEIQVLADRHGNVTHLGERECSLQRRHQKVIEEAPSPAVDAAMRERMGAAAVELARASGYEGAGTVEFIAPGDVGEFFFLEMNTRLQVEHPVTELVWGVDLVSEQLRIAAGERLDPVAGAREPDGHAVEARLYAEDPAAGFLPATGTVRHWREPAGAGIRVDAGIQTGSVVGTEYDPMLAKLIAHGPDRDTAIGRLERALGELELLGVASNAAFNRALLGRDEVTRGELDTGLLERVLAELDLEPPEDLVAAAAAELFLDDTEGESLPPGPWRRRLEGLGEVQVRDGTLSGGGASWGLRTWRLGEGRLWVELDGLARTYAVARAGHAVWLGRDGHQLEARIERRARSEAAALAGSLEAPMPGKVLAVEVAEGEEVAEGDVLMVLESMKMELQITAPSAGVVEGLRRSTGDRVSQGEPLLSVAPGRSEEDR
jgi:acetyl-CoA/propionyl-CoA carboxylase biotin carboxyl carrier protein